MGIDRRRNKRTFKFNKNYIIPFVCIVITCATIIISTCIILNFKQQIPIVDDQNANEQFSKVELVDSEKLQINDMFSFLMSNLDIGQDISNEIVRYSLICKYFSKNNSFNTVQDKYIDSISPDVYRNLGYIFFEDLKDTYYYISRQDYLNTYNKLFEARDFNGISQYYITELDGYIVPKNNYIYDNSKYKINDLKYDMVSDTYIATLLELNILKLYEQKDYMEVENYLKNSIIDNNYLTGKMVKVKFKKINNVFVFSEYVL